MSRHKWTPEPWTMHPRPDRFKIEPDIAVVYAQQSRYDDSQSKAREANAARIVACVNALAGVADPAAFVAAFEAMSAALRHARPLVGEFDYTSETLAVVDAALKLADAAGGAT
jgi:hypothetical protein